MSYAVAFVVALLSYTLSPPVMVIGHGGPLSQTISRRQARECPDADTLRPILAEFIMNTTQRNTECSPCVPGLPRVMGYVEVEPDSWVSVTPRFCNFSKTYCADSAQCVLMSEHPLRGLRCLTAEDCGGLGDGSSSGLHCVAVRGVGRCATPSPSRPLGTSLGPTHGSRLRSLGDLVVAVLVGIAVLTTVVLFI